MVIRQHPDARCDLRYHRALVSRLNANASCPSVHRFSSRVSRWFRDLLVDQNRIAIWSSDRETRFRILGDSKTPNPFFVPNS
jgi:hypothetical protein